MTLGKGCVAVSRVCQADLCWERSDLGIWKEKEARLRSERLVLRPVALADLRFVETLIGDAQVRRYLGGTVPDEMRRSKARGYVGQVGVWLVEAERQALGLVFLGRHREGGRELSYAFHPDAWGQGCATEAARAVLGRVRFRRVVAETQAANAASRRLLERLGMREIRRVERFGAEQVIYGVSPWRSVIPHRPTR